MLSGIGMVVINAILLNVFQERIASDEIFSYWLKQGFTSASAGINILITILAMWIGSSFFRTPGEETSRVKEFFMRMDVPTEPQIVREKMQQVWRNKTNTRILYAPL